MLKSMVSERPERPHRFMVDYVKQTCAGREPPVSRPRPRAGKNFHEYKARVLDPTIRPLMAELFVTRPERPLRAIFQHAHGKIRSSDEEEAAASNAYASELVEIDLFHEMSRAVDTQQFAALGRAIEAELGRGTLGPDNAVMARAQRVFDKGQRLVARSLARAVQALLDAAHRSRSMLERMHNGNNKQSSATKRLRRLDYLKSELSTAVAHAHRRGIPDHEPAMKEALLQIVRIDRSYREEQKVVQQEHRDAALRDLERALEAVTAGQPGAHNLVVFSLHRAKVLRCSPHAPQLRTAAQLVATWEHLEHMAQSNNSFSLGLVGKMKTHLSRHARNARVRVEEMRAAQRELDRKLEDSDDEFYKEMGYSSSDEAVSYTHLTLPTIYSV